MPRRLVSLVLFTALCALWASQAFPADAPPRIIAIGDLHGDLEATERALRLGGAVDDQDRWIGGELVVVQTGDMLDRGDDDRAVLELLKRLETEARAAGGALYVLNGNHETMNVAWRFRYTTAKGFSDFNDTPIPHVAALDTVTAAHRGRAAAFRPGGPWALWLASHPVILQLGDNVFVHGGVLPENVAYGIDRWNADVSAWMRGETPVPTLLRTKRSPVWTRLYSDDPDTGVAAVADSVLTALGAERMIMGHTVQEHGITPRFDARVWCIDTGLSAYYGGPTEVLEIIGDQVRVLRETSGP